MAATRWRGGRTEMSGSNRVQSTGGEEMTRRDCPYRSQWVDPEARRVCEETGAIDFEWWMLGVFAALILIGLGITRIFGETAGLFFIVPAIGLGWLMGWGTDRL